MGYFNNIGNQQEVNRELFKQYCMKSFDGSENEISYDEILQLNTTLHIDVLGITYDFLLSINETEEYNISLWKILDKHIIHMLNSNQIDIWFDVECQLMLCGRLIDKFIEFTGRDFLREKN